MTRHEHDLHKTNVAVRGSWDRIDAVRADTADIAAIIATSRATIAETRAMIRLLDRMNGN